MNGRHILYYVANSHHLLRQSKFSYSIPTKTILGILNLEIPLLLLHEFHQGIPIPFPQNIQIRKTKGVPKL